jgi:rod shape-determining protein MreD
VPRLILALAIGVATLLQAAVLPQIAALQVRPNLVLVLILLWSIARGLREGALWAAATGIALDLITIAPLGTHALPLLSVAAIGEANRTPRFRLGLLQPMLAAFVATLVHDLILLVVQGAGFGAVLTLIRLSLLAGLLNFLVLPVVAVLSTWLDNWVIEQQESYGRPQPPRRPARGSRR